MMSALVSTAPKDIDKTIQPALPARAKICGSVPGPRCENRYIEWAMTHILIGMFIIMVIEPNTLKMSRFAYLSEGVGHTASLTFIGIVAALRACALHLNGTWRYSYKVRAGTALASSVIWFVLTYSLYVSPGPLSLSVAVFVVLGLHELKSCGRAVTDEGLR